MSILKLNCIHIVQPWQSFAAISELGESKRGVGGFCLKQLLTSYKKWHILADTHEHADVPAQALQHNISTSAPLSHPIRSCGHHTGIPLSSALRGAVVRGNHKVWNFVFKHNYIYFKVQSRRRVNVRSSHKHLFDVIISGFSAPSICLSKTTFLKVA